MLAERQGQIIMLNDKGRENCFLVQSTEANTSLLENLDLETAKQQILCGQIYSVPEKKIVVFTFSFLQNKNSDLLLVTLVHCAVFWFPFRLCGVALSAKSSLRGRPPLHNLRLLWVQLHCNLCFWSVWFAMVFCEIHLSNLAIFLLFCSNKSIDLIFISCDNQAL